jgi:flagella basal body P-ring formation protein FlgA
VNQKEWSDKELKALIKKENQKFCADCSFDFEHFSLPKVKYDKISRWTIEKPKELIKGSFRLALKVQRHEEQRPQTYYVTGRLSSYKKLPIARRNLSRGARIMKDDVIFEKRPWNFARKDIPTEKELFGGKLKRMALSGGVIWLSNIEKEKAIERGQLVDLVVKKSDWEIRMKGVAQESGMVGDTVSVLNRKSKKVVMGKVIGTKEVAVQ